MAEMAALLDERSTVRVPKVLPATCARAGCSCRSASRAVTVGRHRPVVDDRRAIDRERARRPAAARRRSTRSCALGLLPRRSASRQHLRARRRHARAHRLRRRRPARPDPAGRDRRHAAGARPARRRACSATASSGSPTSRDASRRRARTRARPADGRPRAARRRRSIPTVMQDLVARCRASACACRPTSCCSRGRSSRSTARCACSRPGISLVAAAIELRRSPAANAGRRPRGAGARRAAGDAPPPAPPARARRPDPHA